MHGLQTIPILLDEEPVKRGTDLRKLVGELVDDRFAKDVAHRALN